MSDPTPVNGAALLAELQPRLRKGVAHICLRPDLVDAFMDAEEALQAAQSKDSANKRLGAAASARTKKLAQRVRELEVEVEKSDVRFEFEAIPKAKFNEITDRHPPRDQNVYDLTVGYNREAVDDELVRTCLIDPVFDDESWQQLMAVCNPSEWEELVRVVREVNGVMTSAPKSVLASRILDKPAGASRRRVSGE
jgi:type I site-specific restriction endonuclease